MMEILYISNTTSMKYFNKLYNKSLIKPGQQVQKFNEMLLRGFAHQSRVYSLCAPPATFNTCRQLYFKNNKEIENFITYDYIGFISLPVIKQLFVKFNAKRKIKKWINASEGKDRIIICYALSPTLSAITLNTAKKYNIKCMAVVTDIPQLMNVKKINTGLKSKIYNIYSKSTFEKMKKYDMYMFLTNAMSDIVNPMGRPFIVIEGMVDSMMEDKANEIEKKYQPKIIIYAGALYEKYGVLNLVEGFITANIKDCSLWLFGNGEMEDYLNNLGNINVKYFGVVPNNEIVFHEIRASLLVNPRPSAEEFTKYSFPSKNMEYMVSGTPLLTCRLPGMPDEYLDYVYIAEDESSKGFSKSLFDVMAKDKNELYNFGRNAKMFVMQNKSNINQAKKIIDFILKN